MSGAIAPLDPPRIIQGSVRVGDTGALEEHDQVVVAVGGTQKLLHGHSPPDAEGRCTVIGALLMPSACPAVWPAIQALRGKPA
ncbi:hypothetical protein [Streptomyces longwoodensis]|uniref:hypothetical protein n=1 Tax=Streptomyces longwoodensis TaxID=68231 RepID=UPI003F5661CA